MPWRYLGYNEPTATKAVKVEDAEIAAKIAAIQQRVARIRRRQVNPEDAARMLHQDAAYLKSAASRTDNRAAVSEITSVIDLTVNAAISIEKNGSITRQALNLLGWVQSGVNLAHGYLLGKPDWQAWMRR